MNRKLCLFLFLILTLAVVGCRQDDDDGANELPAASAVPEPGGINIPLPDAVFARDAALSFVNNRYGRRAPPLDLDWSDANINPEGVVGTNTIRYTAKSCVVTVSYPVVAPEATIYQVRMDDDDLGFYWLGQVDAFGAVSEESVDFAEESEVDDAVPPAGPRAVEWFTYTNLRFGYRFEYPGDMSIQGINRDEAAQLIGPFYEDDYWPWFTIEHYDSAFYRPPLDVSVPQWVLANVYYDDVEEITIAGLPAVHLTYEASPQAYAHDDYYFARDGQLFHITIMHSRYYQDWELYNRFLDSFTFIEETIQNGSDENAVNGRVGHIYRYPPGSQYSHYFVRADGAQFVLSSGSETAQQELDQAAWSGQLVQVWGRLISQMPGLIQVDYLEFVGEPPQEARNLAYFAVPQASSELAADRLGTYHVWSAIDGSPTTTWSEGAVGAGVGEWLLLTFPAPIELTHLKLDIGYDYSADIFAKNHRVKTVRFVFSSGEELIWTFEDVRGLQQVPLARAPGPAIQTTFVRIVIEEIFPGTHYDDACIAEVEVWGVPVSE